MTKAERPGNIARSGTIAQYRRRVPSDLVGVIGLAEIKKSLRTRDPALPGSRRDRNAPKETLGADDRAYILARVEHRLLDRDEMMYGPPLPPMMTSNGASTLRFHPRNSPLPASSQEASARGSASCWTMIWRPLASCSIRYRRTTPRWPGTTTGQSLKPSKREGRADPSAPTLQSVLSRWKAEHQPIAQSASEAQLVVDEFGALAKVSALKDIKKAHVVAFMDWCREQPGKQKGILA